MAAGAMTNSTGSLMVRACRVLSVVLTRGVGTTAALGLRTRVMTVLRRSPPMAQNQRTLRKFQDAFPQKVMLGDPRARHTLGVTWGEHPLPGPTDNFFGAVQASLLARLAA